MPGKPGRYDLSEIIPWMRKAGKFSKTLPQSSDDPLLAAGDSPGLERYRIAKAQLAELDLEVRRGTLITVDRVKDGLIRAATMIRRLGERLGKRFGAEATIAVNETVQEFERIVIGDLRSNSNGDTVTDAAD